MQKREQNKIKERIIYKGGKEMRRNKSGISLIVLVITIIVMIILASAIIISLSNTNILSKANTAVDANNEKEVQNLASLLWSEAYIEYMSETNETTKVANIQSYIDGKLTDDIKAKYDVTATINGVTVAKKGAGTNPDSGNTTYTAYTVGQEVTIGTESFYVIEDSATTSATVKLLAKQNIDTTNLVQSATAPTVAFSTEKYWTQQDTPYDIVEPAEIPASHIAAKAASDYGKKLGGTGRVMIKSEADALYANPNFTTKLTATIFWIGTAPVLTSMGEEPLLHNVSSAGVQAGPPHMLNTYCGVRPVVTIAKTALS